MIVNSRRFKCEQCHRVRPVFGVFIEPPNCLECQIPMMDITDEEKKPDSLVIPTMPDRERVPLTPRQQETARRLLESVFGKEEPSDSA